MKNTVKKINLSTLALGIASLAGGVLAANNASAWGPERTTFTWNDPAPYATFNSITDNPDLGDERNFVRIREVKDGEHFSDSVTLERGKTYEVYIYYHNNADAHDVGKTAIGIADGAAVKSSFPATVKVGEEAVVTGTIFASDTDPLEVWDEAYMNPSQDLYLRYVPGTAIIHNGGAINGQSIGPDYLFGDGALLGYNKFSGILPGCNEYAGFITYQIFADAPDFDVSKTIVEGVSDIKVGDTITFKVRYTNTGTMDQNNVVIKDTLPANLEYIAGSAKLYNNNNPDGVAVNDDIISENGMNIGNYAGGTGWAEVTYQAKAKDATNCKEELVNTVTVSTNDGNKTASAKVTATKDGCTPPPDDCTTHPERPECQEIPNTGPVEIAMAIAIVLGIGGGGYYLYRTRKTLKTTEAVAKGQDAAEEVKAKEDKPETPSEK